MHAWRLVGPIVRSTPALGALLALFAWPFTPRDLDPTFGLDPSWHASLAMAFQLKMPFGTSFVFTYGPLGFLTVQALYSLATAALSFVFDLAFSVALFSAMIWSLRRVATLAVAVAVSYVVGAVSLNLYWGPEEMFALVFVACVVALSLPAVQPAGRWLWLGLGAAVAVLSLVKLSTGAGSILLVILTLLFVPSGRRQAATFAAIGAVPLWLVLWLATGNGLGNVADYVRTSVAVTSGYSAAISLSFARDWYQYWLVAFTVLLMVAAAVAHGRWLTRRARVGLGLVTALTLWFLFKEGFIRQGARELAFFTAIPIAFLAFLPSRRTSAWTISGALGLTLVGAAAATTVPVTLVQPLSAAGTVIHEAVVLASPARRSAEVADSRAALVAHYDLPPSWVARLRGRTVDVDPWEQTVIWAYAGLRFDPLPVIQDYSAYTVSLDQLDTTFLESSRAPTYILRQPDVAIDGRNPAFDPPAAQLAMECLYRQIGQTPGWQLLERGPDRCGPARLLGTARAQGGWIAVPAAPADDIVVASLDVPISLTWKLESLVFKPPSLYLEADGGGHIWRYVQATSADLHILRAAANLGWGAPFRPAVIGDLRVVVGAAARPDAGLSVSFYAVALHGSVPPPRRPPRARQLPRAGRSV